MQENLKLLKQIGWQQLDLAAQHGLGRLSGAVDENRSAPELDMWRTLFDHAPCAIAFADRQGRLIRVNRTFCSLVGSTPAEIINRCLEELIYRVGAGGEVTAEGICAIAKRDGSLIWCRQTTVPCGDPSKQTDWSICYFDEIRDAEEGRQLLVEAHQEFVQSQKALLETVVSALTDGSD